MTSMIPQTIENIKWGFYTVFLTVVVIVAVVIIENHARRTINTSEIEFFNVGEGVRHCLESNMVVERCLNSTRYGIIVSYGSQKAYVNPEVYGDKGFCKFETYKCRKFTDFINVNGIGERVEIDVVFKNRYK